MHTKFTMFDIVIPLGPKDLNNICKQIECTIKNVIGYRNIYIVSSVNVACPGTIFIDESIFPFADQIAIFHNKNERNGWYLQQLIKLYAGIIIPDILDRYLVIDADTYFLKPTQFINSYNQCQYNFGREYNCHYFDHMQRLHPDFERMYELSGICHHMMFETRFVKEMMNKVGEINMADNPFWEIFLEKVDPWLRHGYGSGASEYELYFNYVCKYHLDEIEIRELTWDNVKTLDFNVDLDYVSHHHYLRSDS